MVYGYADFCRKQTGDSGILYDTRVVIRCPYTYPQLIKHNDSSFGFVPYQRKLWTGATTGGQPKSPHQNETALVPHAATPNRGARVPCTKRTVRLPRGREKDCTDCQIQVQMEVGRQPCVSTGSARPLHRRCRGAPHQSTPSFNTSL